MKYFALVKEVDDSIEEEVRLIIDGVEFTAFADLCPYEIKVGHYYPVSISLTVLDDWELREIDQSVKEIQQIGGSFSYLIRGKLNGDRLVSSLQFFDEWFLEYSFLSGKYVEITVDRISVEFLET